MEFEKGAAMEKRESKSRFGVVGENEPGDRKGEDLFCPMTEGSGVRGGGYDDVESGLTDGGGTA